MMRFKAKTVLITGATSGMGQNAANRFADAGAEVVLVGRRPEGQLIVDDIVRRGGKATFFACDLSKESEIERLRSLVGKEYDGIDVLYNNAGIWKTKLLEEVTEEEADMTLKTNFYSVMFMTKHFIDLIEKKNGCIVNNASVSGIEGYTAGARQYIYSTSKAAVIKFTKLSAKNYAPKVRINCICPAIIDTEIYENRDFSRFDGKIPMARIGTSDDVTNVVMFLADSDLASFITGAVIPVDGGYSLT